jgi:hypothetical protein
MALVRWTAGAMVVAGRLTVLLGAALVMRALDAVEHSTSAAARIAAPTVPATVDVNLRGRAVARATWPRLR